MNQKLISKAISGIDLSLVAEGLTVPEAADRTSERTIQMSKYAVKHRVNTRRLMRLVLAACLIFALAASAYAVHYFLGIRDIDKSFLKKQSPIFSSTQKLQFWRTGVRRLQSLFAMILKSW